MILIPAIQLKKNSLNKTADDSKKDKTSNNDA